MGAHFLENYDRSIKKISPNFFSAKNN